MNKVPKNQAQFELFTVPKDDSIPYPAQKKVVEFKGLTFPLEKTIVLGIVFVVITVLIFSMGVARGRTAALPNGAADQKPTEISTENAIILAPEEDKKKASNAYNRGSQQDEKIEILEIPIIEETIEVATITNNFTIQVASFKLDKNAQKEADRLEKKGYEASVVRKGSHSIVCVGKFAQKQQAKKYSYKLKDKYKDCLVRRL